MAAPLIALSDTQLTLCVASTLLVPVAGAGLALINTGLGRSRSAAHAILAAICTIAIAAVVYCVFGFSWQGMAGQPAHVFYAGGKEWNWLAKEPFFLRGLWRGESIAPFVVWLQLLSVGLAAMIPLGSGADRWRLSASCASTVLLAGLIYPLFAHWVWGGGWLAQLGSNWGLGHGFIDVGGAATIQAVGGLSALSIAWILGPRRGKYEVGGMPAAIPGHNTVYALFGCLLALLGWTGLDSASAILFFGVEPKQIALVAVNNLLAASAAALAVVALTRARFGKPDASLTANGWIGGLVAVSGGCAFVVPAAAILIGMVAGILVLFTVEWLDRAAVDDPGGAVSVHAVGGIWGVLAVGILARIPDSIAMIGSGSGQWIAQFLGVATLLGVVLPLSYGLNWILNRVQPQRVSADGERQGMDMYELGASAYPEFANLNNDY